jgi:hypothetical protein
MPRPQFTLRALLVAMLGIVLYFGLRVGWFRGYSNPFYLIAVSLLCAVFGAGLAISFMPRDD